jgi:hypothetical protein
MRTRLIAPLLSLTIVAALGIAWTVWTVSASVASPQEYALYTNDRWHFSLVVPAGMRVDTQDDADNGQTLQFLDATGNLQFQIGTVPYTQLDLAIGEEGVASNAIDQSTELGVVNIFRGDLFKVWFVREGVIYEVIAMNDDEGWLVEILKTWQFD